MLRRIVLTRECWWPSPFRAVCDEMGWSGGNVYVSDWKEGGRQGLHVQQTIRESSDKPQPSL